MKTSEILKDIGKRTNGDVYLGVVGPVRVGKSTFIKRFMELVVIPLIENPDAKKRAIDELPQSQDGNMIMTVEPKFVPNTAVSVPIEDYLPIILMPPRFLGTITGNPFSRNPFPYSTPKSLYIRL